MRNYAFAYATFRIALMLVSMVPLAWYLMESPKPELGLAPLVGGVPLAALLSHGWAQLRATRPHRGWLLALLATLLAGGVGYGGWVALPHIEAAVMGDPLMIAGAMGGILIVALAIQHMLICGLGLPDHSLFSFAWFTIHVFGVAAGTAAAFGAYWGIETYLGFGEVTRLARDDVVLFSMVISAGVLAPMLPHLLMVSALIDELVPDEVTGRSSARSKKKKKKKPA